MDLKLFTHLQLKIIDEKSRMFMLFLCGKGMLNSILSGFYDFLPIFSPIKIQILEYKLFLYPGIFI
jgi:hypothetical protein